MSQSRAREVLASARKAEQDGRPREAAAHYATLAAFLRKRGKGAEAKGLLERAIGLSPKAPRLYVQLAQCEALLGNEDAARTAIREFARAVSEKKDPQRYREYLEMQLKEIAWLREAYYEALLEWDRTSATPFLKLARAKCDGGDLPGAQRALVDALKTKTQDEDVLKLLKTVLKKRGFDEELSHLKNFEKGKLSREDLIVLLGKKRSGAPPDAPPGETVVKPRVDKTLEEMISAMEEELGLEIDVAIDSVAPLIREFRRKAEPYLAADSKTRIDMGLAFLEMGLTAEAKEILSEVDESDVRFLESQVLLGEVLVREGASLGALEVFQRCLRDPRSRKDVAWEARYKLARIYAKLGDVAQALGHARALEKEAPDYRDVHRFRIELEETALPGARPKAARKKAE